MSSSGASRPSREELKRRASEAIDSRADELVGVARTILENPEPGFREVKTSRLVAGKFAELGIPARVGLGVHRSAGRHSRRVRRSCPGRAG